MIQMLNIIEVVNLYQTLIKMNLIMINQINK